MGFLGGAVLVLLMLAWPLERRRRASLLEKVNDTERPRIRQ
jgi:hypothetical protein